MSRKILGLDIRDDSVSAVLVDSSLKENRLIAFEHLEIPEFETDFTAGLSTALKSLIENMDITGSVCITCLPSRKVFFRNIQVPFKEKKKIRQILPFELESALPFSVEDHIFDFQAGRTIGDSEGTDLITAGVVKDDLQFFLDTLATFEIVPEMIVVGGYQTSLVLSSFSDAPESWLFIDIENNGGTLFAVSSGRIILARSFRTDRNAEDRIKKICINIRHTLFSFDEISGGIFLPEHVYISGPGIHSLKNDEGNNSISVEEEMSRFLEVPVQTIDLLQAAEISVDDHLKKTWQPDYMDSAFSLALSEVEGLKGLNFRQGSFAPQKKWLEHKNDFIKLGILAGLVVILMLTNAMINFYSMDKKINHLNTRINKIFTSAFPDEKIVNEHMQAEQMRANIKAIKKNLAVSEETGKSIRTIEILNDIGSLLPKEIDFDITRFVIKPDSVSISGETDSFPTVDDMQSKLEKGELFKKVTPHNTKKVGDRVSFKMIIEL